MEPNPQNCPPEAGGSPRFHFASEKSPEAFASAGAGNGHGSAGAAGPSPADALKDASTRLGELKEYVSLLVAAKVDGVKLTVRKIVFYAILGVVAAVIGVAMLVTAAVYVLSGLAGAIGELFPEPYEWWAGRLIVGVLVVGGTLVGVLLLTKSLTGSSRKRTIDKYENRKRVERNLYGHDVADRARQQAEHERQTTGRA
jgi:hypothetical protein